MTIYYDQGAYKAEIVAQALAKTSNNNPQIILDIHILESIDDPSRRIEQYDRRLYWVITEKTVNFVVDKLEALGFSGESWRDIDPNISGYHSFIGQQIEVYCSHENYEGKDREKWDLSNQRAAEPLDEQEVRKLDALFGRKLKDRFSPSSARKPAPKTNDVRKGNDELQQVAEEAAAASASDDIPF